MVISLTNFTGCDSEFGHRIFFKNACWSSVYGYAFDENDYISNVAVELLNNLVLNSDVRQRVIDSPGLQEQLVQLFSVANSYIAEGVKTYTAGGAIKGEKPVPFNCHLIKIKALLGMICILDDVPALFKKLLKAVKLSSVCSVLIAVKDSEFQKEMATRVEYLANGLLVLDPELGAERDEVISVAALEKILKRKEQVRAFVRATEE